MHTIALFGAGKIGESITALLTSSGRYRVKVCDGDLDAAVRLAQAWPNAEPHLLDISDKSSVMKLLGGCSAVLSALPFSCNAMIAEAASDCGVNYADLTEDVKTTQYVAKVALRSKNWFMPQCGLAPGFISIAGAHLISLFDSVDTLNLRVGALPLYPTNKLKYNLTWSTVGLINEYCNPCEVIKDGQITTVPPLQGNEMLSLDGDEYEAFNTSGGLGTLCHSLLGQVRQLGYKTIRYPGHRDLMAFLLNELRYTDDRDSLRAVFERSIPTTTQDKCIILAEAKGTIGGRYVQKTYASTVYHQNIAGRHFGAIQVTTAAGICGAVDLALSGALGARKGLLKVEEINLKTFLANEFGRYFLDQKALSDL